MVHLRRMLVVALGSLLGWLLAAGYARAEETPARGLRLGREVVPLREEVRLEIDPRQTTYSGTVRIALRVAESVTSFRFHALDIEFDTLVIDGPGGSQTLTPVAGEQGMVTATAARPLGPGDYTLEMSFKNEFGTQAVGLYRLEAGDDWYVFTQFEAVDARRAFPCWDEPGFKIPYTIELEVPAGDQAISNMPVAEETRAGDRRTLRFKETPLLPSYLLAIAVGPLETVPIPGLSIPGRMVTVKGSSGLTQTAAELTPPLLRALEAYFGTPSPFEKLDVIAVPEYWPGAMENPGAITFSEPLLLLDPSATTLAQRRELASAMAHELAHLWFGDLVTMEWWDDLWLNESFATWMAAKITDQVYPELRDAVDRVPGVQFAMSVDALLTTRPMRRPVENLPNLLQSADVLAYRKGEILLGMFEQWVGPEPFRRGIRRYLSDHAWGNATAGDLWAALSTASGTDIGPAMASFLDQPGVPVVSVEALAGGKVRLRQERYLPFGVENPDPAQTWQIPLVMRYPAGGDTVTQKVLLAEPEATIDLETDAAPAWILPNAGPRGYYRWRVPPSMLEAMVADQGRVLDVKERIALVGELSALLDAGALPGDRYLDLLGHFSADPEPEVIEALIGSLGMVKESFITPDLTDPFADYVDRTLAPAVERFGMEKRPGEAEAVSLVRPRLVGWLGDEGQDEGVRRRAEALAARYLEDPSQVDPALAGTALRLAAIDGDAQLFASYRERFEAARVPADRQRLLGALGSFRAPDLVDSALSYTLVGPLRSQEFYVIPMVVASYPPYEDLRYEWMTEHYEAIAARIPPEFAAMMPYAAMGCSAARVEKARVFFGDPRHSPPGTDITLARVEEAVTRCVELREREGMSVRHFLLAHAAGR